MSRAILSTLSLSARRRRLLLRRLRSSSRLRRNEPGIKNLRRGVDEIWGVITAGLENEDVIFTNPVDPLEDDNRSFCSLNVKTGEFWQVSR